MSVCRWFCNAGLHKIDIHILAYRVAMKIVLRHHADAVLRRGDQRYSIMML